MQPRLKYIFGRSFSIAKVEYSDHTSGDTFYHRVYVKLGSHTFTNIDRRYDVPCKILSNTLWSTGEFTVFNLKFNIFVSVGTIDVYIQGSVSLRSVSCWYLCLSSNFTCLCWCYTFPGSYSWWRSRCFTTGMLYACYFCKLFLNAIYFYVKFLVQGGLEVSATVSYYVQPNLCIEGLSGSTCLVKICAQYYSYIDIYPWYQSRTIKRWRVWYNSVHTSTYSSYCLHR